MICGALFILMYICQEYNILVLYMYYNVNVQFQKISILSPQKGLKLPGGGGMCEPQENKEMFEA